MPMSANQLAALVERAKLKAPPVISPPPVPPRRAAAPPPPTVAPSQRSVRARQVASASPAESTTPNEPAAAVVPVPQPEHAAEPDDFPIGWELSKESWHFHRRFFRIFKRPMRRGEYSHLLWQIRHRKAEHLWEDCWRVTLPNGKGTLPVRATRWYLITILPKHWQPPPPAA